MARVVMMEQTSLDGWNENLRRVWNDQHDVDELKQFIPKPEPSFHYPS